MRVIVNGAMMENGHGGPTRKRFSGDGSSGVAEYVETLASRDTRGQ